MSSSKAFSRPCPKNGNYDVFLSFRGKDTRHGFTANLYYALMDNEVYTFMDIKLVGKVIDDLFEIIGRSKMAVVVYSKRFASSDWCLRELETIMQRMDSKEKKMLVIPIFYNVDVHELKHLTGKTGEYFNQHIQNYGETTVQKWKDAITSLGKVSGIPYRDRYERDFIKEVIAIVKDMLEEWEETLERSSKPYSSGPATGQFKVEDEKKESSIKQQAHVWSAKEENTQALALQTDTKAEKELVLTLDHSNFSETISNHDFIVVEFYAPWCEHSKKLAPEYEKAASILSSNEPRVILAKVDADEDVNKELTSEQDINGFPTLKIFRDGGKVVHLYNGPLEAKGIVEYLKKQRGPASAEITSAEDASGLIGDKSLVIVGVFTKLSGEEYDNFITLAEKLRSDYEFAHTRDAKFLPRGDTSVSGPLVRLFKPFDELFVDSEDFNVEALEKFVEESTLPVLTLSGFPTEIIGTNKSESTSGQVRMERSKTEKQIPNILAEDAARIFDDNVPVQQKLKLLNRIATVKDDGTVEFEVPGDIEPQIFGVKDGDICSQTVDDDPLDATDFQYILPLQIVMLIVGTRGEVQPFVAIGKRLQEYGHRVRLATHSNFKEFVLTAGLEFFPLGGDPKVIAGFMVKNKGFLLSGPSDQIKIQRNQMKEIIYSLLPACKDPDIDSGIPFEADAIIANPPAYGHTHVAEALKIPLHIFSTMPWTPTSEFPHPLSRVNQQSGYRLSYQIVDSMIWLGIRDIINDLRKKKLKLRPVTYLSGSQGSDSDVPHGYIWSPHLVPKPRDWGQKVDVVGFCFLDLASNYEPPEDLIKWLGAGEKPIYIGFGSLPVQEPKKMTQIIVEALEKTGQRGIINKGWGGLGELAEPKDSIYLLDNVPHDWLFRQCKAVVHHGGAGTTAAGLKAACPTTIVGDQLFWGKQVHARGVGPSPIPIDEFSLPKLVHSINYMLDPVVKEVAVELAKAMEKEDGVTGAVKAFFKQLPCKKPEPEIQRSTSSFLSSIGRSFGIS